MVNTSFALPTAAYTQQARSSGPAPQAAAGPIESFTPSEASVSPDVAYADTSAPKIDPTKMETDFMTMVAAGVCALVIFSCCCAGNQNGTRA